jgi:dolichol-phosphate mannosyltransferase
VSLVDDGSIDSSLVLMRTITDEDEHFRVIKFSRNFGHQAAISAGIKNAKGGAVIIMDGDLQDPPEQLHRFLEKWQEVYHVIYAIRTKRKKTFKKIVICNFLQGTKLVK